MKALFCDGRLGAGTGTRLRAVVFSLVCCCLSAFSACTPVVSKGLLARTRDVSFEEVLRRPAHFSGQTVVFSGIILDSKNTREGTILEVLQVPCAAGSRPENADRSKGRFLALYDGFLDVAVYRRGRQVTVGGTLAGARTLQLGEIDYTYPLVKVEEIHLWPMEKEEPVYCYPPPYPWHPWWYHPYPWLCW